MDYEQNMNEEKQYLESTLAFLGTTIEKERGNLTERKQELLASRREMWENSAHTSHDFTKLTEMNQYLTEVKNNTAQFTVKYRFIRKLEKLQDSPYFGRFDFIESDTVENEKIYIGLSNIIDRETGDIWVYDWRAPISSIFYRYELGPAQYDAPMGPIGGKVTLKRQYKIKHSNLIYFFDCNITINDEMLQEILSSNASSKMQSIVESIQKEQDAIIRDEQNDLLIVQGTAGSGKTSVALHRIAFLLYQGLNIKLSSQNIVIISPNQIFSGYISDVLPELGEENVNQFTFEDFAREHLKDKGNLESRNHQLERLISCAYPQDLAQQRESIAFKGSECFRQILDRFLAYYERRMVNFEDIYYHGKVLLTRQQLRAAFLNSRRTLPLAQRMKSIELMIFDKLHPHRKTRLDKIQKLLTTLDGHELDAKSFGRLLSIKETKVFTERLKKITEIDYFKLYALLFSDKKLFYTLAHGLKLPDSIESILNRTWDNLDKKNICFEDCAPLLYLKLRLEGSDRFSEIRHVVIDEAQDYSKIQYVVFKLLFKYASFTILGDLNQTIGREADETLYESIVDILRKKFSLKVTLKKSYRSSYEITEYAKKILPAAISTEATERHECEPEVKEMPSEEALNQAVLQTAHSYLEQGYESVAVLCKTAMEADALYKQLAYKTNIKLIISGDEEMQKGLLILPVYMAKGLEFDAVIIHNTGAAYYSSDLDRKLLYVACTRALHRLTLYYTGEKSPFI